MCIEVYTETNEDISTIGKLKKFITPNQLIWFPGHLDIERNEEYCLCGVDVKQTLETAGYEIFHDICSMEIHIKRKK